MNPIAAYPPELQAKAVRLLDDGRLGAWLLERYPQGAHQMRTDSALYDYVQALKSDHLRHAPPIQKVAYDNKMRLLEHALGMHTRQSRIQGSKLKAKRDIRIASLFRDVPEAFLRMIVVHELAHVKESDHGKAFYALCCHMAPDYHQLEFDLRLYLLYSSRHGTLDWNTAPVA